MSRKFCDIVCFKQAVLDMFLLITFCWHHDYLFAGLCLSVCLCVLEGFVYTGHPLHQKWGCVPVHRLVQQFVPFAKEAYTNLNIYLFVTFSVGVVMSLSYCIWIVSYGLVNDHDGHAEN